MTARVIAAAIGCLAAAWLGAASAQVDITDEYSKLTRAHEQVSPLKSDLFGDQVSLYNGSLEFYQTDAGLPGNNALPVAISRRLKAGNTRYVMGPFGDWDLELPHIEGIYGPNGWQVAQGNLQRCTYFGAPPVVESQAGGGWFDPAEYWHGHFLVMPGAAGQEMLWPDATAPLPTDGGVYQAVTKSHWAFKCTQMATGGEGFIGLAPDGTSYQFDHMVSRQYPSVTKPGPGPQLRGTPPTDKTPPQPQAGTGYQMQRKEVWFLPTLVTDRFANTVAYHYDDPSQPWNLTSIVSSDGRVITLSYSGNLITSVTDSTLPADPATSRTWTYTYRTSPQRANLDTVTLPDGTAWHFNLDALIYPPWVTQGGSCDDLGTLNNAVLSGSITHPSGASGTFTMQPVLHGRALVDRECQQTSPEGGTYLLYPRYMPSFSVTSKSITGAGLPAMNWGYSYGPANASWAPCDGCALNKQVFVTDPRGVQTTYLFGNVFNVNDGQLLQTSVGGVTTTVNHYRGYGAGPYSATVGVSPQDCSYGSVSTFNLPLDQRTIYQDGPWYMWTANSFDTLARATSATQQSSLGFSRDETTQYKDYNARWVLGQIASTTLAGLQTSLNIFDDASTQIVQSYRNGLLDGAYGWYGDGSLQSRADGNGHAITFGNYKRGIPQSIGYPDGSSESFAVHNVGVVTNGTDRAGVARQFGYDAAYRLTSIGTPGFNTTTIAYEQVFGSEYGLGAGHWRRTASTGNARTISYYDVMWRPRLKRTFDAANETATNSSTMWMYDSDNAVVFESYPQASIADVNSYPTGTSTFRDAIGRPYQIQADSELGALTTTISHSGGQRMVTIPRGFATTTSFQAFDRPTEDTPVTITAPEDTHVSIARDVWGKPTAVTRWGNGSGYGVNVTRSYAYDGYQRLCKTIEPESGATLQDYDGAGNVIWRATGSPLTSMNCDRASVPAGDRTTFQYDGMNNVVQTTYGDGSPGVSRTYTPDGLPQTISSDNLNWTMSYTNLRTLASESLSVDGWVHTLQYPPDANGNVQGISYPDGEWVNLAPNALGQPTLAQSAQALYATNITYHPNGAVKSYTAGNGIPHQVDQYARGLPYSIVDGNVAYNVYQYDQNANITYIGDYPSGTTTRQMTYDGADRLKTVNAPNEWGYGTYDYDSVDNLRSSAVLNRPATHEYDASNRMVAYNVPNVVNCPFGYDARGNVTSRCGQNFVFDQANRLRQAYGSPGNETYRYDGNGRRSRIANADGSWNIEVYGQGGRLMYGSSMGSTYVHKNYIYIGGKVIAEMANSVPTYVHTDALGSPIVKTDTSAQIVSSTAYEAYGPSWNTGCAAITGPGFTGHANDSGTCMVYMQQRYYDPWAGRFLSTDPVPTDPGSGAAFNRYLYAFANPYAHTDPDGREPSKLGDGCWAQLMCGIDSSGDRRNSSSDMSAAGKTGAVLGALAGATLAGGCDFLTVGLCVGANPWMVGGGLAGGALLGAVTGEQLDRAWSQLDGLISKALTPGPSEYQYALVTARAGLYPDMRNGLVSMGPNEVWKYGTTADPTGRYPQAALQAWGFVMRIETTGTKYQVLAVEKMKLIGYATVNQSLPPGNRIFK